MNFEFATAGRVVFGRGALAGAGGLAAGLGRRALVVTGRDPSRALPLLGLLESSGVAQRVVSGDGEPGFAALRGLLAELRALAEGLRPDLVIGIGGGSTLDLAKALAALLSNGGDPLDYAEIVGAGRPLLLPSLPCIAIPTTAGTGSEVTRNAVLRDEARGLKVSLRSPTMLPALALIDPELARHCPSRVTADSGLDALVQLVEPFVCLRASPLVDALCRDGIPRALAALPRAFREGGDLAAREEMAYASLLGGLALANAGLGAVHGLAGPLGGLTGAPHGALCGALLAPVVSANLSALLDGRGDPAAAAKYAELAALLGAEPEPAGLAAALRDFAGSLEARRLRELGLERRDFGLVAEGALAASSTRANPVALTKDELVGALEAAW